MSAGIHEGRNREVLICLILAVATVAAYAPEFLPWPGNDFVDYDDDIYITDNSHILGGMTGPNLAWAFTSFHGANWFPLTRLSWMLDVEMFGPDAWGFHLTSLVLHLLTALVLYFALLRMTGANLCSAAVAGIFALHPLHVESVAWASYRRDVLSGFWFAMVLLFYQRHASAQRDSSTRGWTRWRPFGVLIVCFVLGLMAKPTLVTLPFVLLLLDVWPLQRIQFLRGANPLGTNAARLAFLEKVPLLLISVLASVLTFVAQQSWGAVQSLDQIPVGMRLANALVSVGDYLLDVFWPVGLAVFYPHPGAKLETWPVVVSGLAILGFTAFSWARIRRNPYFAVGWLWFLGTLVPVLGVIQVGAQARADRYMYLPLIGLSIAIVWAIREFVVDRGIPRVLVLSICIIVMLALGTVTFRQVMIWRDTETLFQHALRVTDDNHVAHINLGEAFVESGRYADAMAHLVTALRIAPHAAFAHAALGRLHIELGRPRDAEVHFRRALARRPDSVVWRAGLGQSLYALGRYEESAFAYEEAVNLDPEASQIRVNWSLALAKMGRVTEAIEQSERAVDLDPELPHAQSTLGIQLIEVGQVSPARKYLERSLELDPQQPFAAAHLGRLLAERREFGEAIRRLRFSASRMPDNPGVRVWLGEVFEAAGQSKDAVSVYKEALELAIDANSLELADEIRSRLENHQPTGSTVPADV
ncbi:tetratricopeptide repeat protein [Myxococcota bacterium]|nr:tetratricopeptide repeat protein [Myxococcota bacterium]